MGDGRYFRCDFKLQRFSINHQAGVQNRADCGEPGTSGSDNFANHPVRFNPRLLPDGWLELLRW